MEKIVRKQKLTSEMRYFLYSVSVVAVDCLHNQQQRKTAYLQINKQITANLRPNKSCTP